ncbi:MAG: hypothetical protein K9J45_08270 [Bacteroidales bacterium]|nr:hypothetical protein [Bacteroidales bacterium]
MKKQSYYSVLICSVLFSILVVFSCNKKDEHLQKSSCAADLPCGEVTIKLDDLDWKHGYNYGSAEYKNDKYTFGLLTANGKDFINLYQSSKSPEMPNFDRVFAIALYLESTVLAASTKIDKEKISAIGVYYLKEDNKAVHALFESKNGFIPSNKGNFTVSGIVSNVTTYLLYNQVTALSPKSCVLIKNMDFDATKIHWQEEEMLKYIKREKIEGLNYRDGEPCGYGCTNFCPSCYCLLVID